MKMRIIKIIASLIILIIAILLKNRFFIASLILFFVGYIIIGGKVVLKAVKNILNGKVFDENFLMSLATIGAFAIGEYPEALAVMLFYQVGELFEKYAVNKSRKSIAELMNIRPDYANLIKDGKESKVNPDQVKISDVIIIKPGERIPLDGVVIEGSTVIDTSALTGESLPRDISAGDEILSGCININGVITARVTKEFGESTVSKILDLVENASSKKSESEHFITKFAAVYTPIVVISAVLLCVVPPLLIPNQMFSDWLYRALTFLVVSCPCALVISVPLSFFGGLGGASRRGILIKGSNYLEELAKTKIVVFDKTGTLTKGVFEVQNIKPEGCTGDELLELACFAESYSNHPISLSLKRAYKKEIDNTRIGLFEEISGHGINAVIDEKNVLAGNVKLMEKYNIPYSGDNISGTAVHVAVNGDYKGYIEIADQIKPDSKNLISSLKKAGIKKTAMLTGDSKQVAQKVSDELGMDIVYSELLPAQKVEKVEELLKFKEKSGKLCFVGDGINDAPVLAIADIGVAMGGLGSDAAIEAADVVIMNDEPSKLVTAIKISEKTLSIVKQNITFALLIKIAVLVLSTVGYASMWAAVFADVGVSFIAVLNALRALKK